MGRFAYGFLFTVLVPAALALWAARLDGILPLPPVPPQPWAWWGVAAGVGITLWGMWTLLRLGGGLPMNAYPPPRLARGGAYAWFRDPIYLGFCVAAGAMSLAVGSAAGAWVVTPALCLACLALIHGHERPGLERRFGGPAGAAWRSLASLPPDEDAPPRVRDVVSIWLCVLLPWALLFEVVARLVGAGGAGGPEGAGGTDGAAPAAAWPAPAWWSPPGAALLLVPWSLFLARSRARLRRWGMDALWMMVVGFVGCLVMPDALPAFAVAWVLLAASLAGERSLAWRVVAWGLACALLAPVAFAGALQVVAGGVLFALGRWRRRAWMAACAAAECVANSWRERRVGPVRFISHGAYAGAAAGAGVLMVAMLAPHQDLWAVALVAAASLLGAALWGQYWVGSRTLLRPFGYFGSLLGILVTIALAAPWIDAPWSLAAAAAVAAPWVQAIGRLRCLVQGCCHGAPHSGGIRYWHERSRVCFVSGLRGVPLHPTPVYSMLGNVLTGCLLGRLWALGAPASFVLGAYLLLAGFCRFVEEGLRGEVQTPVVAGLRLYQWFAIASAVVGAAVTCVRAPDAGPASGFSWMGLALAAAVAVIHWIAMGVDLPEGRWRFSRLA